MSKIILAASLIFYGMTAFAAKFQMLGDVVNVDISVEAEGIYKFNTGYAIVKNPMIHVSPSSLFGSATLVPDMTSKEHYITGFVCSDLGFGDAVSVEDEVSYPLGTEVMVLHRIYFKTNTLSKDHTLYDEESKMVKVPRTVVCSDLKDED